MVFVKKTPAEFEALSEYQKEKYLDEKAQHEAAQIKESADKSAKEAVEAMRGELEKANKELLDGLTKDNDEKLKDLAEKHKLSMEDIEAKMKRAKIGELNTRMKGFSDLITEKLSTDEGVAMIKSFFAGQRESFKAEFTDESVIKAMGVPVGGVAPQFGSIVGPGHDEVHARTVIPVFPTVTNLYKFIQYVVGNDSTNTGFGNVAVGGQKPHLNYIPTVKEAPVRKIAGLLDVPDELIDDVVGFRAWIAYELPKAYLDYEDLQIFKGDGTGENLLGLWYQAANQTFPQGSVVIGSNVIDKTAAGITEVIKLKRTTSAVFVSPVAWLMMVINKGTGSGEYTWPVIFRQDGVMTIAGVPIFWSNVFTDNEGLVGDFAHGTAIMQRMAMNIGYFDQNKDNVEKNVVTIRLEGRLALPIFYPESFKRLLLGSTITS